MKETTEQLITVIIISLLTVFLVIQAIGCLQFSPWVMANGGEQFMCILK